MLFLHILKEPAIRPFYRILILAQYFLKVITGHFSHNAMDMFPFYLPTGSFMAVMGCSLSCCLVFVPFYPKIGNSQAMLDYSCWIILPWLLALVHQSTAISSLQLQVNSSNIIQNKGSIPINKALTPPRLLLPSECPFSTAFYHLITLPTKR